MLYYQGYTISFQEVPDEVSLVFLVADCPFRCPGCHSQNLQQQQGKNLEADFLDVLEKYQDAITCVCFMGEGRDQEALLYLLSLVAMKGYKTCLYTGATEVATCVRNMLDYVKLGPYVEALGGLDSEHTNQKMLKYIDGEWVDITYRFKKEF